jgi:hypothetical protein
VAQRTVVDSLDLCVVTSPLGVTVVPLEWVVSVTTPLSLVVVVRRLLSTEPDRGRAGAVVDWVVVEVEDDDCAKAPPVINVRTVVAASKDLITLLPPDNLVRAGIARHAV